MLLTKRKYSAKIIVRKIRRLLMIIYILTLAIGITLTLFSIAILVAYTIFRMCFTRAKSDKDTIEKNIRLIESGGGNGQAIRDGRDWMLSNELEHHYIISRDGLKLHGILIRNQNKNSKRVAIMVHGYQGAPTFDFSAAARCYYDNGFSLFLPDQRTHGESEGEYITFGAKERYDVVDWCKYVNEYTGGNCEFILSGVSMGATTVILAAAEADMIKLNYITADCGYTSPRRIFTDVFKQWYSLPSFPIMNIANFICKSSAGFSFDEFSTLDAVKKLKAPITFIHGEADDFVIPQNSYDNYDGCTSEKQLITVADAKHGLSYIKDKDKVDAELQRIFDTYFS
jgi:dipeptidyl aminopeptidase/acylaminoacyl peptidase